MVELLVGLAVAAILLGIGAPSFSQAIQESRLSSQYNTMVGSLFLARSEAVKGPGVVTICPRENDNSQQCGDNTNWKNGWLVFIDNTIVDGETDAKVNDDDVILSTEPALRGNNIIKAIASSNNSASASNEVSYVRYLQDGGTQWSSGSFVVCDTERGSNHSRSINLMLTGDIRRGRVRDGSLAPRDVFNQPISLHCPEPDS